MKGAERVIPYYIIKYDYIIGVYNRLLIFVGA